MESPPDVQQQTNLSDSDEEIGYDDYYNDFEDFDDDDGRISQFNNNEDPEYFAYECMSVSQVELLFQDCVDKLSQTLKIHGSEAKLLLCKKNWSVSQAMEGFVPPKNKTIMRRRSEAMFLCDVCATSPYHGEFSHLSCGHRFCTFCWEQHFEFQILQGLATCLGCMSPNCDILATEEFILKHLPKPALQDRYKFLAFQSHVQIHPQLRYCPGRNCKYLIRAAKSLAKRCVCTHCKSSFCFHCGSDYHAPTDCETIKRWLTKCADDSETANYISAHTKDCPKCNICIEKNGGCNHMQCYNCKHDFCWMCLGDWRTHGSEYYECSRYKENPNIAHESAHAQAREALKKYLHYFERWENHSKSMKLEAQTLDKIKARITEKVMDGCGTWIDWQYLLDAASLLAKCRYTLQYTYPYAYYMEPSPRKELFEYQQAQLEAGIENLSWKIEHAETTDRGDLENQIDIAEKRRTSLLKDFLVS